MAGVDLSHIEQNTPEWYEARLGLSTASEYGRFFKEGKKAGEESTMYRNYVIKTALERITGKTPNTFRTAATEWGHDTEQLAADRYELRTGQDIGTCGFFYWRELQTGASPDRLVGKDGLVQIKCPELAAHKKVLDSRDSEEGPKIPEQYYWQMVGELFVTGRKWNDFCSFNPDFLPGRQMVIIRMYAKDLKWEFDVLRRKIEQFNEDVAEVEAEERAGIVATSNN